MIHIDIWNLIIYVFRCLSNDTRPEYIKMDDIESNIELHEPYDVSKYKFVIVRD